MTYNERRPRRQAGASSEPLAPARLASSEGAYLESGRILVKWDKDVALLADRGQSKAYHVHRLRRSMSSRIPHLLLET